MRLALAALALALVLPAAPARADVWVYKDERGRLHFADSPRHRGFERMAFTERQLPHPVLSGVSRHRIDELIRLAGLSHGISPALIKAVVHAESRFEQRAVSHAGARGLMQLMPRTAEFLGVEDPFNAWQNIDGGTRYLRYLMERFDDDLPLTLAAYHAGEGTVGRLGGIPPSRTTRSYVKRVMDLYRRYHDELYVGSR